MKCLKMLAVVAASVGLLVTVIHAGTASATVFCSAQESPCAEGNRWASGTKLKLSLTPGTSALLKETSPPSGEGEVLNTCKESSWEGEISNAGSATATVAATSSKLQWSSCTWATSVPLLGNLEAHSINGTHNGTLTAASESRLMTIVHPLFGSCVFGVTSGADLGEIKEGKPATVSINTVVKKLSGSSFTCPETAFWTASYTLTEPKEKTLAVEPSAAAAGSVLCSIQEDPCPAANKWVSGTKLKFSLASGSSALLKETGVSGEVLNTCKESSLEGEISRSGSANEWASGTLSSLTWGSCTLGTTTTLLGKLEFQKITGTQNGTVQAYGETKLTINGGFFGSCNYGISSGGDIGELKEGKPATLAINAVVKKLAGSAAACPESAFWTASYTLTEPKEKTLAVESSAVPASSVLCSTQENPCPSGSKWQSGTKMKFSLTSGNSANLSETALPNGEGEMLDTCKEASAEGEIANAGGSGSTVTGPLSNLTWGSCTWTTTTLAPGKLEVESVSGTHNGTVLSDAEIKVTTAIPLFGSCVYGVKAGKDLGILTEGKPALFDASAVVEKLSGSSFTCPETAFWTANYTLTEPKEKTLAVEPT
jgi:hypothetical protein